MRTWRIGRHEHTIIRTSVKPYNTVLPDRPFSESVFVTITSVR